MKNTWQDNYNIIQDGIKKLNAQTRTEYEMKAIRLKLTLAIIEDILTSSNNIIRCYNPDIPYVGPR